MAAASEESTQPPPATTHSMINDLIFLCTHHHTWQAVGGDPGPAVWFFAIASDQDQDLGRGHPLPPDLPVVRFLDALLGQRLS
jgi:hypothetical protein